jgi:hypothetical protein
MPDSANSSKNNVNRKEIYKILTDHFANDEDVVVNSGKGAHGIKFNKKMFIMFYKGDLVIKLSPERIKQLINSEEGMPFDPGTGKPMKGRVLIRRSKKNLWITLSEESKKYVMG